MKKQIFDNDAKQIIDLFFNTKIFKENITRDDMNQTEELISHLLESRYDSYVKINKFLEETKHLYK